MPLLPPVPVARKTECTRLVHELLGFPARYLSALPVKVRIRVQAPGLHREIELHSGPVEDRVGALVFAGGELRALALGAEAERLFPADVKGYCLLKLHDPSFQVSEDLALGGVEPVPEPGWPLARVLQALELELRSVELEQPGAPDETEAPEHGAQAA